MNHRYKSQPTVSYPDSGDKSSQLSPISPRMHTQKNITRKNGHHHHPKQCPSAPVFKYESHPRHRNTRVISLISEDDDDGNGTADDMVTVHQKSDSSDSKASASISSYCSSSESATSDLYEQDGKGYLVFVKGLLILNKYKLVRQLGKGTFSRVFECYRIADRVGKKHRPEKRKSFAVKVIRNVYKYQVAAQTELQVLRRIRDNDPDHKSCCIHLVEDAQYKGHPVLVFPLLGSSVYSFMVKSGYKPFCMDHVVDLMWQIVRGVAAIHSMSIIMTDLKPENIVLVDDTVDDSSPNGRNHSTPKSTEIRLIDFGSAVIHKKGAKHTHLIQTRHYRAPEAIFSMEWSFSADIWSIGCILVEFVYGRMLFNTHCSIDHLNQIVKCIGGPPSRMLEEVDDDVWNEYFDDKGYLNMKRATRSQTQCKELGKYFDERHYDEQYANLYDLCKKMLCWNPKDRITAKDALKHAVFADYDPL